MGQEIDIGDLVKLTKRNRVNHDVIFETFRGIVIAKGDTRAMIRTNTNKKIVGLIAEMDRILASDQTIMHSA